MKKKIFHTTEKRFFIMIKRTIRRGLDIMFFMESGSNLANFIRLKMKEQNLSAYDVARHANNEISPTTITKILNGEVNRSGAKTLALIGRGLGVTELDMFRVARGDDVSRPLHFQIYAERLDAADISDGEWPFIELNFRDYIQKFRAFKAATQQAANYAVPEKGYVVQDLTLSEIDHIDDVPIPKLKRPKK